MRDLRKLDRAISVRLVLSLLDRLAPLENPRQLGHALRFPDRFWRYRVADYRIICRIVDKEQRIVVVAFRHWSEAYPSSYCGVASLRSA